MMARGKRGKELAEEMREEPRTRPAAQWCSVCEEWTSWAHKHASALNPDGQGGR